MPRALAEWGLAGIEALIRDGVSGRELIDGGFPGDVEIALELGASRTAPLLRDGAYQAG
jgi:2-phosphosulfolactate phosphatase